MLYLGKALFLNLNFHASSTMQLATLSIEFSDRILDNE